MRDEPTSPGHAKSVVLDPMSDIAERNCCTAGRPYAALESCLGQVSAAVLCNARKPKAGPAAILCAVRPNARFLVRRKSC